jgi:hypothetical protein
MTERKHKAGRILGAAKSGVNPHDGGGHDAALASQLHPFLSRSTSIVN